MRLNPEVRKEAEEKLGKKLPEPDEPGFYALLEELREKDPELAALLEEGIEFEQVRPPEEEVRQEVKKRAFLRDLYNRLFNRYDELTGEWVPSRPKQILIGVGGLMGLVVFMWALNNLGGPKRPAQAQTPPPAQSVVSTGVAPATPEVPGAEASPSASALEGQAAPGGQAPQVPAPPAGASGATGEASLGTAPSTALPETIPPPPTPSATGEVPPPPQTLGGAGAYSAQAAPMPTEGPSLTLYLRPTGEAQAASPSMALYMGQAQEAPEKPSLSVPLKAQAQEASAGPGLAVYQGQAGSASGQVAPVSSFVAYRKAEAPQAVPSSPAPPQAPQGPGLFEANLPEVFGGRQAPSTPPSTAPSPPSPTASSPYLPGTRLSGRLAVKLVVPEGQEVPVALETEDGATFLGKAKLSPTRRVEVNLDQAVLAGKVFPVRAVVLGSDLAQGLPAQVREEAPSLVADLVRGSLRGLSDYVRARSQQTTVTTTPSGTVIQQGQTPPLELFLGAAAADLFSVPEGTRAVVRVAEVAQGTPLTVLVLGAGQ